VTTDFALDSDQAFDLAIQDDGKILVAGSARVSGSHDFALARYNSDGSLDLTFEADGKLTTDIAGVNEGVQGVALQGDGRIVATGFASAITFDLFALARYNVDGSLDTSFDDDGKVTTDFATAHQSARSGVIQKDGKIVVAGLVLRQDQAQPSDVALARYNMDGSLDPTFSGDGRTTTDFAAGTDEAHAVVIERNGKIVVAGIAGNPSGGDFGLARYKVCRPTSRRMSIPC
jgi:uncharacterized delta-60 repeat protein